MHVLGSMLFILSECSCYECFSNSELLHLISSMLCLCFQNTILQEFLQSMSQKLFYLVILTVLCGRSLLTHGITIYSTRSHSVLQKNGIFRFQPRTKKFVPLFNLAWSTTSPSPHVQFQAQVVMWVRATSQWMLLVEVLYSKEIKQYLMIFLTVCYSNCG